jgi:hypothetical protein
MKCFSKEIYAAYLDNELSQIERTMVSDHLSTCRACRDLTAHLENENLMIKNGFSIDLPEVDLVNEITQRITSKEVLINPNGQRLSYVLYTVLTLSGIGFPIIIFQLFSSSLFTFQSILALMSSPLVMLLDKFFFISGTTFETLMIDMLRIVVFIAFPTILVFFWISFLFNKGCEALRKG